jgi:regulator of protease activity HflC (stomatin/prohibitin superfamily)
MTKAIMAAALLVGLFAACASSAVVKSAGQHRVSNFGQRKRRLLQGELHGDL